MAEVPIAAPLTVAGAQYKLLKQEHAEYDADLWEKLELLAEGGFRILKQAKQFLPRLPSESDTFYAYRCEHASYINHLGPVIGYLVGSLFKAPIAVSKVGAKEGQKDFWSEFSSNCDLAQTRFSTFMGKATFDALLKRRAIVALDMPKAPPPGVVKSRLDEEVLGLGRVWLDLVPIEEMLDWKCNESAEDKIPGRKKFEWLKLRRCITDRSNPLGDSSKFSEQFRLWTMGPGPSGEWVAHFSVFQTPERAPGDPEPKDEDIIPLVEGPTATSFREIPYIELDLGPELWLGNKAGPLAMEHYRDRSSLKSDMMKSLNEIPYIQKGTELGEPRGSLPSMTQQDPNRGNNPRAKYSATGWLEIGSGDTLAFAGPSGVAHKLCVEMLDGLRDDIHRSGSAMNLSLANNGATVGRSGESKREDRDATTQVLQSIATIVHRVGIQIYACASKARAEQHEWSSSGLDSFDREDRPEMVVEAPIVQALAIPSETFQLEYQCQLVQKVLKASPEVFAKIRQEIQTGVKEAEATRAQQEKLMLESLKAGVGGEEDGDEDDGASNAKGEAIMNDQGD